jgi:homoserine kinase
MHNLLPSKTHQLYCDAGTVEDQIKTILAHIQSEHLFCWLYETKMSGSNSNNNLQLLSRVAALAVGSSLAYYIGLRSKALAKMQKEKQKDLLKEVLTMTDVQEKKKLTSVVVRVPATTANMGPGFDTIGMALDIWTEISVEILSENSKVKGLILTNEGEGADQLPTDDSNLVIVGLKAAYKAAGETLPQNLKIHCKNRIPFARGLGSSSAGIVGGIIAGLALSGKRLPVRGKEELLQLASEIEGHPDNVAPAIYGGLQLGIFADDRWYSSRVQIPDGLQCVVFIPDSTGPTSVARAILPKKVRHYYSIFFFLS